jgi:hypothetical protein
MQLLLSGLSLGKIMTGVIAKIKKRENFFCLGSAIEELTFFPALSKYCILL